MTSTSYPRPSSPAQLVALGRRAGGRLDLTSKRLWRVAQLNNSPRIILSSISSRARTLALRTQGTRSRLGPLSALERVPICSYGPSRAQTRRLRPQAGWCVISGRPDSWHVCSMFLCPRLTIQSPHLATSSHHCSSPAYTTLHTLGDWVDDQVSNTTNQLPASPGRADDCPLLYRSSGLYCMILGRVFATPDLLISRAGPISA